MSLHPIRACARQLLVMAALAAATSTPALAQTPGTKKVEAPRIEVVFVLDTTGSMGGLLEGAKQKIWSIANQLVAAKPAPNLRIGLLPYRDRGDAYITRFHDLTADIDSVYDHLQQCQAEGGGDTPESVNQALHEAVTRASWSADTGTLKIVFLVGDCPPHMDYQEDVKYPVTAQLAVKRNIILNTIQCGAMEDTTKIWQDIARRGEGSFVALPQSGGVAVIPTPMDAELAALNVSIGRTLVPYGSESEQKLVAKKQAVSELSAAAAPSVVADRLAYNLATERVVQGGGDLLDDLRRGGVKLESVKASELPKEMQGMTLEQRKAHLKQKEAERDRLRKQISELSRRRQAFLDQAAKNAAPKNAFDLQVADIIRTQALKKGIHY